MRINYYIYIIIIFSLLVAPLSLFGIDINKPHGISINQNNGKVKNLSRAGNTFIIEQSYGNIKGNNLFHSFEKFNIHSGEEVKFKADSQTKNIINRVTGGEYSWINGIITTDQLQINMYLMNSAGIVFGPEATLNINGSFHITTADWLKFNDKGIFYSDIIHNSILTTSEPSTFGFYQPNESNLTFIDTKLKAKSISIIGKNISIKNSKIKSTDEQIIIGNPNLMGTEVSISINDNVLLDDIVFTKLGAVVISEKSSIDASGVKNGNIIIRAGDLYVNKSYIITNSGLINISAGIFYVNNNSELITDSGLIDISVEDLKFEKSNINSFKIDGNSGDIIIKSLKNVLFFNDSFINSSSYITTDTNNIVNAGDVSISGYNISFLEGSGISSHSPGTGGHINITAKNLIHFERNDNDLSKTVTTTTLSKSVSNAGPAGDIFLEAKNILFKNGGGVEAETKGAGNGGNVTICAYDKLIIDGATKKNTQSGISASSSDESTGHAGNIKLDVGSLILVNGGIITNTTNNIEKGGEIEISASELISIIGSEPYVEDETGIFSRSKMEDFSAGDAGKINMYANQLKLFNNSLISTTSFGGGNAGDINLNVNKLCINKNSGVSSESLALNNGGSAGTISINANDSIKINSSSFISTEAINAESSNNQIINGKIDINAQKIIHLDNSQISTSIKGGKENSGDINIKSKYTVLTKSKIIAQADQGNGGNINIANDCFISSNDSIIDASSKKGIDGKIYIENLNNNKINSVFEISNNFLNNSNWVNEMCDKRNIRNLSHLIWAERDAVPIEFDDWISSPGALLYDSNLIETSKYEYVARGIQLYKNGEFELAIKQWEGINHKFEKTSLEFLHINIYLSYAYKYLGYIEKAFSILENINQYINNCSDNKIKSDFFNNFGDLHLLLGNQLSALDNFEKSITFSKLINNPIYLSYSLNNMGNALSIKKNYSYAFEKYLEAIQAMIGTNNNDKCMINTFIYLNMARNNIINNRFILAKKDLEISFKNFEQLPDSYLKTKLLIFISIFKVEIASFNKEKNQNINNVLPLLATAAQQAHNNQNYRFLSYITGLTGKIFNYNNNYTDAIKLTKKALFIAQQLDASEIIYLWQWQLGRIYKSTGHNDNSLKMYQDSINEVNSIRMQLFKGTRNKTDWFKKKIKQLYLENVGLRISQINSTYDSNTCLSEIRDIIDLLKKTELNDFYKDDCIKQTENQDVKNNSISPNTAVIYPILFSDNVTLIISLHDTIKYKIIPIEKDIIQWTKRLVERLRDEKQDNRYLLYSRDLYDLLIKPIEKLLNSYKIETLVISPDDVLRLIPFAVLHDGKQFLIEKYALVIIPGISLTDLNEDKKCYNKILLTGLSEEAKPALHGVKKELFAIQSIINNSHILIDKEFTLTNFENKLRYNSYSSLVIATHAMFGGSLDKCYLDIYDGKLNPNDMEYLININRYNNNIINLIIFSSCETAMGNERSALGLAGIALKTGVKSVVATLWSVHDSASFAVMKEFFIQYKFNISKSKALQRAQKKLIANNEFKHPYFWSPYVLIGNWY